MSAELNAENATPHGAADDLTDRGDEVLDLEEEKDAEENPPAKEDEPAKEEEKEPEAEAEIEEEEEEPAAKKGGDKQSMIPRARLNAVREREQAAIARVQQLERELEATRNSTTQNKNMEAFTAKVDSLYEEVALANAEGDYKKAAKMQRELDDLRDSANAAKVQYVAQQAALRSQEEAAYNALVDQIELLAPELNPQSDEFDIDQLQEVDSVTRSLEAQGVKTADALKRAVKYVLGRNVFAEKAIRREVTPTAKKTDVVKNITAAKKIPPTVEGSGIEKTGEIDASKLTDEEWNKLPKATKARLRGDSL